MATHDTGADYQRRATDFYLYALLGGSVVPFFIVGIIQWWSGTLVPPYVAEKFLGAAFSLGLTLGVFPYFLLKKQSKLQDYMSVTAVVSFILLHLLVCWTGGSLQSYFVSYYLYSVAIVGIIFPTSKKTLYMTVGVCLGSYTMNLFYPDHLLVPQRGEVWLKAAHLSLFIIQLVVASLLVVREQSERETPSVNQE